MSGPQPMEKQAAEREADEFVRELNKLVQMAMESTPDLRQHSLIRVADAVDGYAVRFIHAKEGMLRVYGEGPYGKIERAIRSVRAMLAQEIKQTG